MQSFKNVINSDFIFKVLKNFTVSLKFKVRYK